MSALHSVVRQLDRPRIYGRWIDWWRDFQTRRSFAQSNRVAQPAVETRLKALKFPVMLRPGTTDFCVASEIFQDDEYALALSKIGQPQTIIDLGLNVGLSVLLFAERFPTAKIIGVETSPQNFAIAQQNIQLAGLSDRVTLFQSCVNATGNDVEFETVGFAWDLHVSDQKTATTIRMSAVTMQSLMRDLGGSVDFLKCDIEGGEQELFADCRGWIDRVKTLVVETHGQYTPDHLIKDIQRNGGRFQSFRSDIPTSGSVVVFVKEI